MGCKMGSWTAWAWMKVFYPKPLVNLYFLFISGNAPSKKNHWSPDRFYFIDSDVTGSVI